MINLFISEECIFWIRWDSDVYCWILNYEDLLKLHFLFSILNLMQKVKVWNTKKIQEIVIEMSTFPIINAARFFMLIFFQQYFAKPTHEIWNAILNFITWKKLQHKLHAFFKFVQFFIFPFLPWILCYKVMYSFYITRKACSFVKFLNTIFRGHLTFWNLLFKCYIVKIYGLILSWPRRLISHNPQKFIALL